VVRFPGTYHAILGRPCYAKFMAVPNYTYLKHKMPRPNDVITISTTSQHAYQCDIECIEQAEAIVEMVSLITSLDGFTQDVPDPKRHTRSFEPAEETKLLFLNPEAPEGNVWRISSSLVPKSEVVLVDFLCANADVFAWSPSDMPSIPREVAEHSLDI